MHSRGKHKQFIFSNMYILKFRPEIVDRGWGWVGRGKDLEIHTIFNLLGRNLF